MEEVRGALQLIENQKFVTLKDYQFCYDTLNNLQNVLVNRYQVEIDINKHVFVQANLNLFLYTIENVKREIKKQCFLRLETEPKPDKEFEFNFKLYYHDTKQTYETHLHTVKFIDMPKRIRRIVRKQDDGINYLKKIYGNFLVEFYREPITKEMALKAVNRNLNFHEFWANTAGEFNPLLIEWLEECEENYYSAM